MLYVEGECLRRQWAWRQLPAWAGRPFAILFKAGWVVLFWNQLGGGFALLLLLSPELQRLKLMVNKIVRLWPSHAGQAHWGLSLSKGIKEGKKPPVPKTSSDNDLSDWVFITKQHPEINGSTEEGRGEKKKERKATVFLSLSFSFLFFPFFFFFAHLFFKTVRSFQYFKSEENSLPAAVFEVVMVSKSHDWLTAVSPRGAH